MPHEIVTLPCLQDNYAFVLHDPVAGSTVCVDVPEAAPVLAALTDRGWQLDMILLTHHHPDHIDGVAALRAATGARVIGAAADLHRLPPLDLAVTPGNIIEIGHEPCHIIDVPGHTVGHIAFWFPLSHAVFTGDSLMAMGCGRLFEGTPEQMWNSLQRLAALPPETEVCSGHEYTAGNARFALTIEPGNPILAGRVDSIGRARAAGRPTVPSRLSLELDTNPFLRAAVPAVKAALGMAGADDAAVFAEIRARKDRF